MAGHGWVTPNPDGVKARCGGPGICPDCRREAALAQGGTVAPLFVPPRVGSRWRHYLGSEVLITGFCRIEATSMLAVLYRPIRNPEMIPYARPVREWRALMSNNRPRFEEVKEDGTDKRGPDGSAA
jgi:hypothetical protein